MRKEVVMTKKELVRKIRILIKQVIVRYRCFARGHYFKLMTLTSAGELITNECVFCHKKIGLK